MKVKIGFYCTKEKKSYKAGDKYTGKRTDINHVLVKTKVNKKK